MLEPIPDTPENIAVWCADLPIVGGGYAAVAGRGVRRRRGVLDARRSSDPRGPGACSVAPDRCAEVPARVQEQLPKDLAAAAG